MNLRGTSKILYFFRIIRIFPSYLYEPCNNQRARYFESDRNRSIRRSVSIRQFHVEIFHRNARGGKKEKSIVQPIIARCAGLSFKSPSQASDTFDLYILDKSDQPWGPRIDSRKPTFAFRKNPCRNPDSLPPRFLPPTLIDISDLSFFPSSPPPLSLVTKVAGPFYIRTRSTTDPRATGGGTHDETLFGGKF